MSTQSDQNEVSTALALLRDSLAEEEQRIRNEGCHGNAGGRMKKTKNGVWEISDKGRKWLKENSN